MSNEINAAYVKFEDKMNEGILVSNEKGKQARKAKSYDKMPIMKDAIKFSPTSSSMQLPIGNNFTTLVGKCARSVFFQYNDYPETNPATPEGIAKMDMGKAIETQRQGYLMESGYLHGSNDRFLIEIEPGFHMSIETDGIILDDELGNSIWECKSTYEKGAREVFGSKTEPGHPKWEHCLQMMSYLVGLSGKYKIRQLNTETNKMEEVNPIAPHFCINETIDRAAGSVKKFMVFVMKQAESGLVVASPQEIKETDPTLLVPGWYDKEFDRIDYIDLKLSQYLAAAKATGSILLAKALPERQAEYQYSPDKIEYMHSVKLISKTKYENWKRKGLPVGDWQCRYCYWKDTCLGATPWIGTTVPKDEDILKGKK